MNCPDLFAWELFVRVNQRAPKQLNGVDPGALELV